MPYTQHTVLRNTSASSNDSIPDFPAPPTATATAMQAGTRTPEQSPAKRVAGITQTQKQALIDNLQLEITERARKLRAQYALQAQGLKARLEMRVNRIPQALRKRNMQDLMDEHTAKARPTPPAPMPVTVKPQHAPAAQPVKAASKQPLKRKSDDISTAEADDKENVPSEQQDIANPKKRSKVATATANTKITRTRNAGPAGVLSPRSHNSRNLPQSPIKPAGGLNEKAPISRSVIGVQIPISKSTRAPSRQTKRPGTAQESDGRASEGSTTSAGTTIVTKPGTRKAAVPKKAAPARATATSRKPAAPKVEPAAATRTLRKRN